MDNKVKILKYIMILLTCIAVGGTVLPNALDPNETLGGKISIATFGTIGACLLMYGIYFIEKKAILRGEK